MAIERKGGVRVPTKRSDTRKRPRRILEARPGKEDGCSPEEGEIYHPSSTIAFQAVESSTWPKKGSYHDLQEGVAPVG